jgi:hypothetical protein
VCKFRSAAARCSSLPTLLIQTQTQRGTQTQRSPQHAWRCRDLWRQAGRSFPESEWVVPSSKPTRDLSAAGAAVKLHRHSPHTGVGSQCHQHTRAAGKASHALQRQRGAEPMTETIGTRMSYLTCRIGDLHTLTGNHA